MKKLSKRVKGQHIRRYYQWLAPYLKSRPLKLEHAESGPVLVLAPHVDDEIIGPGGTLRQHILAGDAVSVAYFYDLNAKRRLEAKTVAKTMGFCQQFFLNEDQSTLQQDILAMKLRKIIDQVKPKFIYLPSLFELHNDHLAVNHLLGMIYNKHDRFTIYAYEVWTTIIPNVIVDISNTIEIKQKAIAHNHSQIKDNDWITAATALNRYRAIVSGLPSHAEGFLVYSCQEYHKLWKKIYA